MCLITEQKKPIKIRKDRTVYKIVTKTQYSYKFTPLKRNRYFEYTLGILHTQKMHFDNIFKSYMGGKVLKKYPHCRKFPSRYTNVHEGFHSMLKKKHSFFTTNFNILVECTIPKGSLIFTDKTGLIVSNQIIINKILK